MKQPKSSLPVCLGLVACIALVCSCGGGDYSDTSIMALAEVNSGLVAYYPFNGDAYDASGNGNDGLVEGATLVPGVAGIANSAYDFDGVDDVIRVPNSANLQVTGGITIAAWVYWEGARPACNCTYDAQRVISKKGTDQHENESYAIGVDGSEDPAVHGDVGVRLDAANPGPMSQISFDTNLRENRWYHLAVTYDGTETRIYVNGREVTKTDVGGNYYSGPIAVSPYDVLIGNWEVFRYDTRHFNGVIDDIRIYDRGLSFCEVWHLYKTSIHNATMDITGAQFDAVQDTLEVIATGSAGAGADHELMGYVP